MSTEADNDTQFELAAWELLKEARQELADYKAHAEKVRETISRALLNSVEQRDKLLVLVGELRDVLAELLDPEYLHAFGRDEDSEQCIVFHAQQRATKALTKAREALP